MKDVLIPERLSSARKALSITKMEAAKRMDIGQGTYVRYENGDRNPSYPIIVRMAQVLKVSPEYLVGKTDNADPDSYVVVKTDNPEMYNLVKISENLASDTVKRLLRFAEALSKDPNYNNK